MIGIIIQARTGSSRLPSKVLLPFHDGKSILELLIDNIRKEINFCPVIVATSTNWNDNAIEDFCLDHDILCYRGDEFNVLSRFIGAAEKYRIKKIIRICSDNLFIDIQSLYFQITKFNQESCDYWAFCLDDKTPTIKSHFGFWGEGVTLDALKKIYSITNENIYLEHVTSYIYENSGEFKIQFEKIPKYLNNFRGTIRLTIDTLEDFHVAQEIYQALKNGVFEISIQNILSILLKREDLLKSMEAQIRSNVK